MNNLSITARVHRILVLIGSVAVVVGGLVLNTNASTLGVNEDVWTVAGNWLIFGGAAAAGIATAVRAWTDANA